MGTASDYSWRDHDMKYFILSCLIFALPVSAATRSSVATDNFNRGTGLGANWTDLNGDWGNMEITSSTVYESTGGAGVNATPVARWVGAGTFTDDQYAKAKWVVGPEFDGDAQLAGVIARASADLDANRDYYHAVIQNNAPAANNRNVILGKITGGGHTQLAATSLAWAANDTVEIEAEGSSISSYRNGTLAATVTDSALATGLPGITASDAQTGDDWEGGNLVSATPPAAPALQDDGQWFMLFNVNYQPNRLHA
jgi:hypothetical protein